MAKTLDGAVTWLLQLPPPSLALVSAAGGAGLLLALQTIADYRAYGRFAYNIYYRPLFYPLLYVVRWIARGKEWTAKLLADEDTTTFIRADFPERRGPRAQLPKWPLPHRHIPQMLLPAHIEAIEAHIREAGKKHDLLLALSLRERVQSLALYSQRASAPKPLVEHDRLHVHIDDGSVHVSLPPRDAGAMITKGWAIAFPLAGRLRRFGLDPGLILLYAPRDDEELQRVLEIIDAGVQFNLKMLPKA